jgi:hypothetical protein
MTDPLSSLDQSFSWPVFSMRPHMEQPCFYLHNTMDWSAMERKYSYMGHTFSAVTIRIYIVPCHKYLPISDKQVVLKTQVF